MQHFKCPPVERRRRRRCQGVEGAAAAAHALSLPAEAYGNDAQLEVMWAMKAYNHAEVYFNLISSVDPKFLKLTKTDDMIYTKFREDFPDFDVKMLDPDLLKSAEAKEKWRPFCNHFESLVEDFNYGTLLRLDCEKDYTEENTIFATRIQFFAIEIARNREGYNLAVYNAVNTSTIEYIVIIEVNVSEEILFDQFESSASAIIPLLIENNTDISDFDIIAVCLQNASEYHCRCEDQYVWSYNNCMTYNACDSIEDGTCTCIRAVPSDGQVCEPKNVNTTTPPPTVNTTDNTTTPPPTVNTTDNTTVNTTTPPPTVNTTDNTTTPPPTVNTTDNTTCSHPTVNTTTPPPTIDKSYRLVPGYQANSVIVTGFRPGSVIAEFSISTTDNNLNLSSANNQLATDLTSQGFSVDADLISQSVEGELITITGNIYPGTNLKLICKPPQNNSLTWTLDDIQIKPSDKYEINNTVLTVRNAVSSDSGKYSCRTTMNSLPYIIFEMITIQPYPDFQVSSDKIVQCKSTTILLRCCVQDVYQVYWTEPAFCNATSTGCISCNYTINEKECQNTEQTKQITCQLTKTFNESIYNSKTITITVTGKDVTCSDSIYGVGNLGDIHTGDCSPDMVGYRKARCNESKLWDPIEDNCVLRVIINLKEEAEAMFIIYLYYLYHLQVEDIQEFMVSLSSNATLQSENIINSAATITTIVDILTIVSNLSQTIRVSPSIMTDFLTTTEVVGTDGTSNTWQQLNKNSTTSNASNILLNATEGIARRLPDENTSLTTNFSSLNKTLITAPFFGTFGKNLTTQIYIPVTDKTFLTVLISSALNNILPVRNLTISNSSQTRTQINSDVVLIETNAMIQNISLSFNLKNELLRNPQCVFWNFTLLNNIGGWDSTGCKLKLIGNLSNSQTCECNHTTSFSILMSPFSELNNEILDYITYIGVGISMGSLVLCLIIEFIIWKSVTRNDTSYMRHVSIVNVAFCLLIANICFIIGAAVNKNEVGPCSTATFFMHFFYLALFFWMLLSALLLLYRTLMVFSRMSRGPMMGIGFTVGYGAPLLIAVITVASTAGRKGYIQQGYNCWLNWNETKALLAFVIPALTIVAINLLVLIVVLCKMLRREIDSSYEPEEKNALLVIAKCVGILTPLFGLTWGFGIGTMVSSRFGVHVVFAFLNSLQSTGASPSASSGFPFFQRLRRRLNTEILEYILIIEVNVSQIAFLDKIISSLESYRSTQIDNTTQVNGLNITTVCSLNGTEYQCKCEDEYFWPCEKCSVYGSCDDVTNGSCSCINAIPNDGNFCQPFNELTKNSSCPAVTSTSKTVEYLIEIEINAVDITVLKQLWDLTATLSLSLINSNINIIELNITTVCSLNGMEYQCRCEDQYFWPCEKCLAYGSCDDSNNVLCGCINAFPNDGHFCQPISELAYISTCLAVTPTAFPSADYLIEIEMNAVDITVLKLLRNLLATFDSFYISSDIDLVEISITTVCSLIVAEYQCRCEDQYFWPCGKCSVYGFCDDVITESCACSSAYPYDGHFCQPIHELSSMYYM
ncbi:Adhesion G protein-coupled receptor F5 [Bagarius yarrelli]|uniref:Adhesion G protein-coupled receptor F5 n=1 Tax=Bagarius yarrelli TaxID=175774 RepID=A0A556U2R8_BAGYA|nr:Adhesion G protein-coupled receptor F5 [Bagarius yarrelli]